MPASEQPSPDQCAGLLRNNSAQRAVDVTGNDGERSKPEYAKGKIRAAGLGAAAPELHARHSANEQPTGEAEHLAGPRDGPVGLPR